MAAANTNQIMLPVTEAMRLGASTRGLENKLVTYIVQLIDADCAGIRSLKVEPPLSAAVKAGSREEKNGSTGKKTARLNLAVRDRLCYAFEQGASIEALCVRFGKSQPVIYRELERGGVRGVNRRKVKQ